MASPEMPSEPVDAPNPTNEPSENEATVTAPPAPEGDSVAEPLENEATVTAPPAPEGDSVAEPSENEATVTAPPAPEGDGTAELPEGAAPVDTGPPPAQDNAEPPEQGDDTPPDGAPPTEPPVADTLPTDAEQAAPAAPTETLAATDDSVLAEPGSVLIIRPGELLDNDKLPTGEATIVAVSDALHGTVQLDQANDRIIFDAEDGYFGPGGFSYTITDLSGAQATAQVNVGIVGEVGAGAPRVTDDQVTTLANQALEIPASQLLANDRSPGPEVVLSGVTSPVHGTVALDPATSTITFTPEQNFLGQAGFDYLATASSIGTTAHVSVTVTAPPPDAVDDTAIIQGNRAATLPAALLLANDEAGLPGATPRIVSVGAPENGSVALNHAGDVVFTPERGFSGDAGFDYTITDRFGGRDTASVLVQVTETPSDAPAQPPAINITQTTITQTTITQVAIINQIIQSVPATTRIPADGGDGGGGQGLGRPVQAWFAGTSPAHGAELWGYDGRDVAELADISRGASGSLPADMVPIGGTLLFSAADLVHGREPWAFDGASARLLGDLNLGDEGSNPADFTLAGQTLYFTADDGSHGREVWAVSAGEVRMVADLASGLQGSDPEQLTTVNGALFAIADDGVSGGEVWRSGADGRLTLLADLDPGQASSAPDALTEVNGSLFFIADDGLHGRELYELRPGADRLVLHDELTPGGDGSFAEAGRTEPLVELDGRFYAVAANADHGATLWVSNPQGGSFERVAELGTGLPGQVVLVETEGVGGRLYVALSDSTGGDVLARYDTATGRLDQDVAGDPAAPAQGLTAVGDNVFYTQVGGAALWQDDGFGARQIDLAGESLPHDLAAVSGRLAFSAGGRLGVVDPEGAARASFATSDSGADYFPTDITPVHPDALMLI